MAGYSSTYSKSNGDIIQVTDFSQQFTAISAAMDATTGHSHSGAAGEGAPISLSTGTTGTLPVTRGGTGAATASAARTALGLELGVNAQAYDAGLQSISGLTTSANKGIYTTASDTYATYDLTATGRSLISQSPSTDTFPYVSGSNTISFATVSSFARTILDDANAAAVLTTIGAQALDAELTAIAGLTSAADRVPYFTGSGTAALATFTTFGRSLVDDADAATARVTLAAADRYPTMTTQTGDYTLALTDAHSYVRMNSASSRTITVPANATVAFPTGTEIILIRYGTGALNVAAAGGVTINSPGSSLSISEQYGMAVLYKIGTNEWMLGGAL